MTSGTFPSLTRAGSKLTPDQLPAGNTLLVPADTPCELSFATE
ncbi:MAG TPA: hypothetical protein VGG25_13585 [Streptosporangiaceae bacterium]|jgi:hypothetical protein